MILNNIKRKIYTSTEEQEVEFFNSRIEESHLLVKQWNQDVAVFRNEEGQYFARELKYARSEKGEYDIRYVALSRYVKKRKKKTK